MTTVGERIRTSGPCLPKTVLYHAAYAPTGTGWQTIRFRSAELNMAANLGA